MNMLSAFGSGLWIIPLLLLFGVVYNVFRYIKQRNSGSYYRDINGVKHPSDKPAPFFNHASVVFGLMFLAAFIGVVIWMINDK